jgi:hypothetical protein
MAQSTQSRSDGPAGRLKSLHRCLEEHPSTAAAYVLNTGNVGAADRIRSMPLYTRLAIE